MKKATKNYIKYIEDHTLRLEASRRGGGIEIDLSDLFTEEDDPRCSAYQNYLGGGMTGSVQFNANFDPKTDSDKAILEAMGDQLKRYFFSITNEEVEDWDEWAAADGYDQQQARGASAY